MKILLIEDELALAESILAYLKGHDFVCDYAHNLETAQDKILEFQYDCIVLDLMLPDGNGFDLLKMVKKAQKTDGIILISAKDGLETRIEGLTLGADDFLTKPFHLSELMARVWAIIRRKNFAGNNRLVFQEITLDLLAKTVFVHQKPIELTKKELDLLLYLIGNAQKVLSKASIAEHLSGDMADMLDNHDFIYTHIKNLKKKLSEAGSQDYIKTVYGLGYKWQA